jgi:hypothetical protein
VETRKQDMAGNSILLVAQARVVEQSASRGAMPFLRLLAPVALWRLSVVLVLWVVLALSNWFPQNVNVVVQAVVSFCPPEDQMAESLAHCCWNPEILVAVLPEP